MKSNIFKAGMLSAFLLGSAMVFTSCEDATEATPEVNQGDEISASVLQRLEDLQFNTEGIKKVGDDYLVEGDMIITPEALANMAEPTIVEGPQGEQYRTYNLVSTPRTIRVRGYGLNSTMSQGLDMAIANYNALNMGLSFVRTTGSYDILVRSYGSGAGGVAGFPTGNGAPYSQVNVYPGTASYGVNVIEHVMTHEIGHCLGLRHTDYMNRSYSCGSGGNEGSGGVGAVNIPGTPSGIDSQSIMLSCFSANEDGEFSYYDRVALEYLY